MASARKSAKSPPITPPTIAPTGAPDLFAALEVVEAGTTVDCVVEAAGTGVDKAVDLLAIIGPELLVEKAPGVDSVVAEAMVEIEVIEPLPGKVVDSGAVDRDEVGGRAVAGQPPFGLHGSTAQHPVKVSPTRLQEYHWNPVGQSLDCRFARPSMFEEVGWVGLWGPVSTVSCLMSLMSARVTKLAERGIGKDLCVPSCDTRVKTILEFQIVSTVGRFWRS